MAHYGVPGVAIAVIRDGHVAHVAGYGVRDREAPGAVGADTLFSVGSVSKVVAAATALRLVAQDRIELDRDIDAYLDGWQVPPDPDRPGAITLRMLLSHTAGLNVHGFQDYLPGEPLPTLLQTLRGESPAKNEALRRVAAPGAGMRYSGGGITVVQKAIEDVSGQPFERAARDAVLAPLGMTRSRFADPPGGDGDVAMAHDALGAPVARPRGWQSFPELAASGLWTSARDLAAFVAALNGSYRRDGGFLPQAIARDMMTEVEPSLHGLGPRLGGSGASRYFHHGGANDSYRAWIEGHLGTGDGLVILTNGQRGHALFEEIRAAVWDVLDPTFLPLLRTQPFDPDGPEAGFAGDYVLDPGLPEDLRGNLARFFERGEVRVRPREGGLALYAGDGEPLALEAIDPGHYVVLVAPDLVHARFLRDAHGRVHALLVERGTSRLYFRPAAAR
nr:serine hydrolase domain-containing protein [Luteimonas sp. Y-2-2-4F]